MKRSTLNHVFCAAKPIWALAIGILADQKQIDLDRSIGEQFSRTHQFRIAKFSPRDILYHNAGLENPRMHLVSLLPDETIEPRVYEEVKKGEPNQAVYSEYTGWAVLDAFIEDQSQKSAKEFIKAELLEPLALEGDIYTHMNKEELEDNYKNIGAFYCLLPVSKAPSLLISDSFICNKNTSLSTALVTMSGIGRLYRNILSVLNGESVKGLPSTLTLQDLVSKNRGLKADKVLKHPTDFVAGFMTKLNLFGFRGLSDRAFGSSALAGSIFMFADPELDLSAAVYLNGMGQSTEDVGYLIGTLTKSILDDYENLDDSVEFDQFMVGD